ncbi:MAG: redoxin domain-containing protein [Verrucomicrobiota bacterium]
MKGVRFKGEAVGITAFVTLFAAVLPLPAQLNFNLPCLAPLLEQLDEEAPRSLEEAFVFGPWHAPLIRDDVGKVDFPIATDSEDAQMMFNQGLALLHGFSYREAERCFRAALALDNDSPMIYWALAMANERLPGRAAFFASMAARHSINRSELSPLERRWLALLGDYYRDIIPPAGGKPVVLAPEDWEDRRKDWVRGLEDMAFEFPDDVEVKAFLLRRVILDHYRDGVPIASYFANHLLADELAKIAPDHPSGHYRLFLWMKQNPGRAVVHAGDVPQVAPGQAEMWRFSGQLLVAAGRPREAVPYFQSCLAIAHRETQRPWMMPDKVENLVANYEALVDVLVGLGRHEEARAAALQLASMPRKFHLEKRDTIEEFLGGSYATGRRLLGQVHLRMELWNDLLRECESGGLKAGDDWFSKNDERFWRGIAHAHLGDLEKARALVEEMKTSLQASTGTGVPPRFIDFMAQQARTLRTEIEYLEGARKGMPERETDRTWLPSDHNSRVYYAAGLKEEALALAREDFAARPGQVLAEGNFIDLHFRHGDLKSALYQFDKELRMLASESRGSLPLLSRLAPVAEKMGIGKAWALNAPSIESDADFIATSLPPWSSPEAPSWGLPDHTGEVVSVDALSDGPVLVNFFLGVSCAFCREQIEKFRPVIPAFEEAGIRYAAISQDSLEVLQEAMGGSGEKSEEAKKLYPFTVLADPEFEVFRLHGAYDDFEKRAMHGTVLLDRGGRVLWSEVGHGPFNFPQDALHEALRILSPREG